MELTLLKKAVLLKATKQFCFCYYFPISIREKIETFKAENLMYPNFIVVERSLRLVAGRNIYAFFSMALLPKLYVRLHQTFVSPLTSTWPIVHVKCIKVRSQHACFIRAAARAQWGRRGADKREHYFYLHVIRWWLFWT